MNNKELQGRYSRSITGGIADDEAFIEPDHLAMRIINGQSVLPIWAEAECLSPSDLGAIFNSPADTMRIRMLDMDSLFAAVNAERVIKFCHRIHVHPAHLVPLLPDPELALPLPIYQANVMLANDRSEGLAVRELAMKAIECEADRYKKFMGSSASISLPFRQAVAQGLYKAVSSAIVYEGRSPDAALNIAELMLEPIEVNALQRKAELSASRNQIQGKIAQQDFDLNRAYSNIFCIPKDIEDIGNFIDRVLNNLNGFEGYQQRRQEVTRLINDALNKGKPLEDSHDAFKTEINHLAKTILKLSDMLERKLDICDAYNDAADNLQAVQTALRMVCGDDGAYIRHLFANHTLRCGQTISGPAFIPSYK